jgi:hypothetical protein
MAMTACHHPSDGDMPPASVGIDRGAHPHIHLHPIHAQRVPLTLTQYWQLGTVGLGQQRIGRGPPKHRTMRGIGAIVVRADDLSWPA